MTKTDSFVLAGLAVLLAAGLFFCAYELRQLRLVQTLNYAVGVQAYNKLRDKYEALQGEIVQKEQVFAFDLNAANGRITRRDRALKARGLYRSIMKEVGESPERMRE